MHPPSDASRSYLYKLRHEELMREAEHARLAEQCSDPGLVVHVQAILGSRLRAMLSRLCPATLVCRCLDARTHEPVFGDRALKV